MQTFHGLLMLLFYLKDKNGKYHGGYRTATPFEVTEAASVPLATSAQQAELYVCALT